MKVNKEYQLYRQVATYMKYQYPGVIYHFDPTGLYLTKTQAGMLKAIQYKKGFPDLAIYPKNKMPLFIELKAEGTNLLKVREPLTPEGYPNWSTPHIAEQHEMIERLEAKGYRATFGIGWDDIKNIIDSYLKK